jgi:hypothetical protein
MHSHNAAIPGIRQYALDPLAPHPSDNVIQLYTTYSGPYPDRRSEPFVPPQTTPGVKP